MEVAQDGIRIVLVEPGGVKTGIWDMAETDMQGRAGSRYRTSYERSLGGIRLSQPFMADPNAVARVIARALGARSPRPRYLVGSTRRWPRRSTSSCPRPSRTASRGWRVICSAASDERTLLRVGPYSL
jgi:NAD(P)-dependent dehydrogenase (short-subunit alcohol dehydrogenase family)